METRNNDTIHSRTSTTPTRTQTVAVPDKAYRERTPAEADKEYKRVALPDGTTLAFTEHSIRLYDVDPESDIDARESLKYRELTNAEVAEILGRLYS